MIFWFNRFIIAYKAPKRRRTDRERGPGEEFHAKMELHHSLEACEAAVPALLAGGAGHRLAGASPPAARP